MHFNRHLMKFKLKKIMPLKVVVSFSSKSEEEYKRTRLPVCLSEFNSMFGHIEQVSPSTACTYHS